MSYILIAEDSPSVQEMLCRALELTAYHVIPCTGRNAILAWIEHAPPLQEHPFLVLLDLSISIADATDFLSHMRAKWLEVLGQLPQIIVLTTNEQVFTEMSTTEHVLLKPFHICDLLALVRHMPASLSPWELPGNQATRKDMLEEAKCLP